MTDECYCVLCYARSSSVMLEVSVEQARANERDPCVQVNLWRKGIIAVTSGWRGRQLFVTNPSGLRRHRTVPAVARSDRDDRRNYTRVDRCLFVARS